MIERIRALIGELREKDQYRDFPDEVHEAIISMGAG